MKRAISFRLSNTARNLLIDLAKRLGISKTAVMEIAVREKAQRENLYDAELQVPVVSEQDTRTKS